MEQEQAKEKIEFQFIMNYKAYRREMIATRIILTLVVAGGLCGLCALSVIIGILVAAMALFCGVISILVSLGNEQSYTVYNTRVVIKRKNNDTRVSVPIENVTAVKYKRAFYEKDLATGTVVITAKTDKGAIKRYRLRHVFDAMPAVEFLKTGIKGSKNEARK